MIKIENVTKYFKSGDTEVHSVDGISLELKPGTISAIVGKSGSGKSTLLSLLGALDKLTSGTVEIDGQDVSKISDHKLTRYRCQRVGFIFQSFNLVPNLTARENVMLPMEFAGQSLKDRKKRAAALLDLVGLKEDKQDRKPGRLSGGEQQRVAIARSLGNQPKIILADEPTGNLDSATGETIIKLLSNLAKQQSTTVVVVTHDEAIAKRADRTFRLKDGKLVA
jgi:putative ABC transport system ATP-binding protein